MSSDLKKLYSDVIKAHNEVPFHYEKSANTDHVLKAYNPICGDRFEIYITAATINRSPFTLYFTGFGCAISKASTSVMAKSLTGKSNEEALLIVENFLRFIRKEIKSNELISPEFEAFSGVHDFPERFECAALAWKEMKKFLETKNEN